MVPWCTAVSLHGCLMSCCWTRTGIQWCNISKGHSISIDVIPLGLHALIVLQFLHGLTSSLFALQCRHKSRSLFAYDLISPKSKIQTKHDDGWWRMISDFHRLLLYGTLIAAWQRFKSGGWLFLTKFQRSFLWAERAFWNVNIAANHEKKNRDND